MRALTFTFTFTIFWVAAVGEAAGQAVSTPQEASAPAETVRHEDGRVTVRAVRLSAPLVLDGRLDESVYHTVPPITDFIQQEPEEGRPATQKTEGWVFFDDESVYISLRCWMSNPEQLVANEMRRDNGGIWSNDNVGISLDTFRDGRSGFFYQTNALGGVRDGLVNDERTANYDYNGVWDVRSRRFEDGWATELAIPFKTLRYGPGREQVWGLILQRVVRGINELSYVTHMPASYGGPALFKFSSAATLVGIEAPATSKNLEIKPYAVSDLTTNRLATPAFSNDLGARFGVDAKYGVTKGLTLDVTYNTDFAQVEADDQQINLTRFNLFLPEKREFFLEGQGIFAFGGVGSGFGGPGDLPVLFFSRTIGINNAQSVPIRAGGRLTGRAGAYTIGLLDIQTGESNAAGVEATNFSVVRVKRDFLRRSSIGVIATNRSRTVRGDGSNHVAGVDAGLQFFQDVQVNTYYARTSTPGLSGDRESYLGQFKYAADRYGVEATRLKVGDAFNPEVGFLRRRDFRRTFGLLRFSPRPQSLPGIRKLSYEASVDNFSNGAGQLQSRLALGSFRLFRANGDTLDFDASWHKEVLALPFRIARGVVLPPGAYRFDERRVNYQMGPQRRFTGSASISRGSFYSGDKTEVGYNGRVELTHQISVEPRISINRVRLPVGNFTARVVSARGTYSATPRMFVVALVQYNSSDGSFGTNVRFRWEYTPGSDLFVVYSEGRDTLGVGFPELLNRGLIVKYTRLVRF